MAINKNKKKKKIANVNTISTNTAAKKAAVLGTERKSKAPLIIASVCAILVFGRAFAFYSLSGKNTVDSNLQAVMTADAEVVSYPANLFEDGKARHFKYQNNDITVRYFILKSSDGIIRAAFDACDVCWPAGKGYYQEGDFMVCRNCGRRFASILVNEVKGGCNPAPLKRELEGSNLVININDIIEGKQYFNFSGRV